MNEKSITEAVTEPETMTWGETTSVAMPYLAQEIVAWINANGGQARYEPRVYAGYGRRHTPERLPARIVISGPDGDVVMHPGDTAVRTERWFEVYASNRDWSKKRRREFTVRRPSPEESHECPCGRTDVHGPHED